MLAKHVHSLLGTSSSNTHELEHQPPPLHCNVVMEHTYDQTPVIDQLSFPSCSQREALPRSDVHPSPLESTPRQAHSAAPPENSLVNVKRRSLGSGMGLTTQEGSQLGEQKSQCTLDTSNALSDETFPSHNDVEGQHIVFDKHIAAVDDSLADICASIERMKREIIIVEMEEEQDYSVTETACTYDGELVNSVSNDRYQEDSGAGDDYVAVHQEQSNDDGKPEYVREEYNYLEPVAEVTEEPTVLEWEQEPSSSADSAHAITSHLHEEESFISDEGQSRQHQLEMTSWARLHGLATPSTISSNVTSSHFGWAEVIASARRTPSTMRQHVVASPIRSPARMIGLGSKFWLSSPPAMTLLGRLSVQRDDKQRKHRNSSIKHSSSSKAVELSDLSGDDSGWADVVLDDKKRAVPKESSGKRASVWSKRLSGFTMRTGDKTPSHDASRSTLPRKELSPQQKRLRSSFTTNPWRSLLGKKLGKSFFVDEHGIVANTLTGNDAETLRNSTAGAHEHSRSHTQLLSNEDVEDRTTSLCLSSTSTVCKKDSTLCTIPDGKEYACSDQRRHTERQAASIVAEAASFSDDAGQPRHASSSPALIKTPNIDSVVRQGIKRYERFMVDRHGQYSVVKAEGLSSDKVRCVKRTIVSDIPGTFRFAEENGGSSGGKQGMNGRSEERIRYAFQKNERFGNDDDRLDSQNNGALYDLSNLLLDHSIEPSEKGASRTVLAPYVVGDSSLSRTPVKGKVEWREREDEDLAQKENHLDSGSSANTALSLRSRQQAQQFKFGNQPPPSHQSSVSRQIGSLASIATSMSSATMSTLNFTPSSSSSYPYRSPRGSDAALLTRDAHQLGSRRNRSHPRVILRPPSASSSGSHFLL